MVDYLRDPGTIYARSFALIRAEVPLGRFPESLHALVLRLVHACGMPEVEMTSLERECGGPVDLPGLRIAFAAALAETLR